MRAATCGSRVRARRRESRSGRRVCACGELVDDDEVLEGGSVGGEEGREVGSSRRRGWGQGRSSLARVAHPRVDFSVARTRGAKARHAVLALRRPPCAASLAAHEGWPRGVPGPSRPPLAAARLGKAHLCSHESHLFAPLAGAIDLRASCSTASRFACMLGLRRLTGSSSSFRRAGLTASLSDPRK